MSKENNEQTRLLTEILKWIRFTGIKEVKSVLISELDTDQKKQVYQLSDGSKTIAEINKITNVSTGSISGYWKKWVKLGLGEKNSVQGGDRFNRAFDLEDFDIKLPQQKEDKAKEYTLQQQGAK